MKKKQKRARPQQIRGEKSSTQKKRERGRRLALEYRRQQQRDHAMFIRRTEQRILNTGGEWVEVYSHIGPLID